MDGRSNDILMTPFELNVLPTLDHIRPRFPEILDIDRAHSGDRKRHHQSACRLAEQIEIEATTLRVDGGQRVVALYPVGVYLHFPAALLGNLNG